jgi:uncharacterized protein YvpB
MSHSHIRVILGVLLVLLLAGGAIGFWQKDDLRYDFPFKRTVEKELEDITDSTGALIELEEFVDVVQSARQSSKFSADTELPPKILIEVPFMVQAPLGNWDMPYQEACEEASLIMVHHYLDGTSVTPSQADAEILDIVAWENEEFNYSADVTIEELKKIAEDYYDHRAQLFYDPTIEDMKRLLAAGHPIVVPLAGRELGNPYYSGEGPWYHMLVVTGYDGASFITNDVGTKRGHNYKYPQQRFHDAIHNWTGVKEDITQGRKVILVVEK